MHAYLTIRMLKQTVIRFYLFQLFPFPYGPFPPLFRCYMMKRSGLKTHSLNVFVVAVVAQFYLSLSELGLLADSGFSRKVKITIIRHSLVVLLILL